MSVKVVLDARAFARRFKVLQTTWKVSSSSPSLLFGDAPYFLSVIGGISDEMNFVKSTAIQTWLFGYEFPNTLLFVGPTGPLHIVSGDKKAAIFEELQRDPRVGQDKLSILKRGNPDSLPSIHALIQKSGNKVGGILKDHLPGPMLDEWSKTLKASGAGDDSIERVEAGLGWAQAMARKDDEELGNVRMAAKSTASMLKNEVIVRIASALDEERKVSHEALSEECEGQLDSSVLRSRLKLPSEVDVEQLDWCYSPIIQSGGKYELRPSAVSDDQLLTAGVIILSCGLRYKGYCANAARTLLISPDRKMETNYTFLLDLQSRIIPRLRDGVTGSDIYGYAIHYIRNNRPDLEEHFVRNCGFGTGIEFRESAFTLSPNNKRALRSGQVINLSLGFQQLPRKGKGGGSEVYALWLVDTLVVGDAKSSEGAEVVAPALLTDGARSELNKVCFYFKEEDEEEDEEGGGETGGARRNGGAASVVTTDGAVAARTRGGGGTGSGAVIKSKFRSENQQEGESEEAKRITHQEALFQRRQQEGMERYGGGEEGTGRRGPRKPWRRFASYAREDQLPPRTEALEILVDRRNTSIILPINGQPVPFHLSTLKNVVKSEEGEYVTLRFNFITPGLVGGGGEQVFEDPNATFVRAFVYRSRAVGRLSSVYKEISDLRKTLTKMEAERKEREDIVRQDKLIEGSAGGGRRPERLPAVFARPTLDGKRVVGDLEIHSNGLRYQSPMRRENRIDLLFSNIRHLFFQPCDHELLVILHVHLKNPIMIGKRKAQDVQFYREATDSQFDETGQRRRGGGPGAGARFYGDEDELEAEQEERRRRRMLNGEFKAFADKIAAAGRSEGLVVDVPMRELGFPGVPFRANVLLQPTTDCLVHLTDVPFLVLTLEDVELVHLERVTFGLKNFDMVFLFRDFSRTPFQISTVPMERLQEVKEWLDGSDVLTTEGPVNLNWTQIMKTVTESPKAFFEEGGWGFLLPEGASGSEGEDGVDEESEESEYAMSTEEEEDEEDDDDDEEDFDESSEEEEESFSDDDSIVGSEEDEEEEEEEGRQGPKRSKVRNGDSGIKKARR
ncbi:MAG: putative SPT16-general chromatin factor [Piptocephalis tieghemiana]|nr:MAG: putative SPT16-general chromatin factor [Piptocephalis tieghemiana]